jgi:hypothetical protein
MVAVLNSFFAVAALVALAGCAAAPSGPVALCQAQGDSTPAVKDLTLRSVSNPYFMSQSSELIASTKAVAVRDCLKRQGILPAGSGVEGSPRSDTVFQK